MVMRNRSGWGLTLLVLASAASGQTPTPAPAGPLTGDKIPPGSYTGKLLSVPKDDGVFTVEVTTEVLEVKPNAQTLVQNTAKFQQDWESGVKSIQSSLATGKDTAYHQNRMREHQVWYQRHLPNYQPGGSQYPYQVKKVVQNVDFTVKEDFKVRLLQLAPEFDDKGKPKRYTPKELRTLKGDPKLPGYEAKKEDLNTGALVKVTLVRQKPPKKSEATAKDLLSGPKHLVTTVVIISKDGNAPMPMPKLKAKP